MVLDVDEDSIRYRVCAKGDCASRTGELERILDKVSKRRIQGIAIRAERERIVDR
jgi:hypothetical protein